VYLLAFVNRVRAAQSRPPLDGFQRLPLRGPGALEAALGCRLESGTMRFASARAATDVAAYADLRLGRAADTVELPSALRRFVHLLEIDLELSPDGQQQAAHAGGW
jgi:hypothetical protein